MSEAAALGFRTKTGRAIAVILAGPPSAPQVVSRGRIDLYDPAVAATGQPYHEVLDLSWPEAQAAVAKTEKLIDAVTGAAVAALVKEAKGRGYAVAEAGIVGAPDRDLARIGNPHIRAHAAEGVLFRKALDRAAEKNSLGWRDFAERGLDTLAAAELGLAPAALKERLAALGRTVGPPWRADERAAAIAAWLLLAGGSSVERKRGRTK